MKKILLFLFASAYTVFCMGQTLENDSVSTEIFNNKLNKTSTSGLFPRVNERNIFENEISIENKYNTEISGHDKSTVSPRINMNIHVPEFYQGPVSDYLSNSRNPFSDDYNYHAGYRLSDRSWLTTQSAHSTFLMIGSISNIDVRYNYKVADNFTVTAGTYISGYSIQERFRSKSYNDAGINSTLKYSINDRISIHAFGQYSAFARKNKFDSSGSHQGLFPQTYYGGAFEYKVTDRFGIMGGMNRELNPMTGKWKNVPFVVPVFYSK